MPSRVYHRVSRFIERIIVAALLTATALVLSLLFYEMTLITPFIFFYASVSLAAFVGGLPTGLLATGFSVLAAEIVLLLPSGHLHMQPLDYAHIVIFAMVGLLISWLNHSRIVNLVRSSQSRDEFEALLENIYDAVTAEDVDGRIIFANAAAARLWGYDSVSALVGQHASAVRRPYALLDRDGKPMANEKFPRHQVFSQGLSGSLRFKLRFLDDGSERWMMVSSAPLAREGRRPHLAVNVYRDITESVESQHVLHQLLDNMPVLVGMMTVDGRLIEANRMSLTIANLTREDVIGKHLADTYWCAYDPQVQASIHAAIARAVRGETVRQDLKLRIGDDQFALIDFSLSPICDEGGKVTGLVPSGVDMTERRRSEQERAALTRQIADQRARLEAILNRVPGIVWEGIGKPDGTQRILYVNPYAETLLGYPVSRWYQEPSIWGEIVVPEDMPNAVEQAMRVFDEERSGVIEFRMRSRDGRIIPVESYAAIVNADADEAQRRMCGVIMDVSARKHSELLLNRYMARLKSSNEELKQFAYVASHDLQEPLRMISSYLQLIESRYKDKLDDDGREFIYYAVDGSNRMKRLIQDLLLYSRVETRKGQFEPVDMNQVIDEVRRNLEVSLAQTDTRLEVEPLPVIQADHGQMVQLLQNLINNAIKFRSDSRPEIKVSAQKLLSEWQFNVQDNGIGIDPRYQERIFVIFQRLHGHGKYPGTGIGLAICKRVVERHDGHIWFTSEPGQGTTFHFTIPEHLTYDQEEDDVGLN